MELKLPLGRELLAKEGGPVKVDVLAVRRDSKHTVVMVFRKLGDRKLWQDRFDGSPEECNTLELEAAGKDVHAVIRADGSDKGMDPEIESVEVVGND